MKKILMGLAMALVFFVLMIVLFVVVFIFFFTGDEEMLANGDFVSSEEMQVIVQKHDSLLADVDSLLVVLAQNNAAIDSLELELTYRNANLRILEENLQERDAEIESLRQVGMNAQDMAKTFATMSVAELTPIVARLSDDVVIDIYRYTTTKRRKYLLTALGDDRAAALTNRLVKKEGS
ncbi:MAG: hypothetical protein JSW54_03000 [Fidelibacterota bacterium]|nr:MAG: hypothetical protein JSW54_03000 [Candidatus Neomarinimicrobiota bacterium]